MDKYIHSVIIMNTKYYYDTEAYLIFNGPAFIMMVAPILSLCCDFKQNRNGACVTRAGIALFECIYTVLQWEKR